MKKSTSNYLKLAVVCCVAVGLAGCVTSNRSSRKDLEGRAEIRRDEFGVPHVTADTVSAAVYGFAYAQAEDQISGITQRMLNARGELSKYFGPSMVDRDVFARRFHLDDGSALKTMNLEIRDLFDAYALGVNAYISDHREQLPDWIQPITPKDVLGASRAALMLFAFNRGDVIKQIQAEHSTADTEEIQKAENRGSNMWALAPSRTTSGKAILMGNPHLSWDLTWYEGQLTVPGKYNIYGAAFVGGPVPTIAFNEALGWSHTVNYPDTEDVYVFQEDPDKPDHILYDGASHALKPVSFQIDVKTDEGMTSQDYLYWETDFGPVIHRADDKAWVLKSSLWGENDFVEQWFRMGQARNLDEFKKALDLNAIPMFNVIYADRDGHIYYRWMARLPKRPEGQNGKDEVEVTDSSVIWSEIHPGSDLPQLTDPEGGYVQNSNDPPWYTNLNHLLRPEDFPVYMPEPKLRLRTQHGLSLIANTDKFSIDQVIRMKFSLKMLLAERIKADLVAAAREAAGRESDPSTKATLTAAADTLDAWDGTSSRESRGSTLLALWWERYSKENDSVWKVDWTMTDPTGTPRGLGDAARGVTDLVAAAEECKADFGAIDVAWGDVHRLRRGSVDLPMNGAASDLGSFRVIDYKKADDGKFVAYGGDGWIFSVEFGDVPHAFSILAYGESGDENAPHATDQLERFINGELKPVYFTEPDIEAHTVKRYKP